MLLHEVGPLLANHSNTNSKKNVPPYQPSTSFFALNLDSSSVDVITVGRGREADVAAYYRSGSGRSRDVILMHAQESVLPINAPRTPDYYYGLRLLVSRLVHRVVA